MLEIASDQLEMFVKDDQVLYLKKQYKECLAL